MPVRIIEDTERYPLEYEGSTFYFRRIPSHIQRQFIEECTVRGETNWEQVGEKRLKYALLGWEMVLDGKGDKVPFAPEYIQALPDSAILALGNKLLAADPLAADLKN